MYILIVMGLNQPGREGFSSDALGKSKGGFKSRAARCLVNNQGMHTARCLDELVKDGP